MEQTKNEIVLRTKIQKWNREKSVAKMQKKVTQWKTLTVEIARELFLAHQNLTSQRGQRTNPEAEDYIAYTWGDYCEDIGINRETARRWLKRFIPAELNGKKGDYLLSPDELKAQNDLLQKEMQAAQEARFAYFERTGKVPEDWTRADQLEWQRRQSDKAAKAIADRWSEKALAKVKPRKDYFQEILEISARKRAKRFALATQEQTIVQEQTFIALDQYLSQFDDYQTRLYAAVNLQERLKQQVNIYAEEVITQEELKASEESDADDE